MLSDTASNSGSWDLDTDGLTLGPMILAALLRYLPCLIHTILSDRMQVKERQNRSPTLLTYVALLSPNKGHRDTKKKLRVSAASPATDLFRWRHRAAVK